jgi:hypothetical protein
VGVDSVVERGRSRAELPTVGRGLVFAFGSGSRVPLTGVIGEHSVGGCRPRADAARRSIPDSGRRGDDFGPVSATEGGLGRGLFELA